MIQNTFRYEDLEKSTGSLTCELDKYKDMLESEASKVWTLRDLIGCKEKEKEQFEQKIEEQELEIKRMQDHIDQIQEKHNQLETVYKESQNRYIAVTHGQ